MDARASGFLKQKQQSALGFAQGRSYFVGLPLFPSAILSRLKLQVGNRQAVLSPRIGIPDSRFRLLHCAWLSSTIELKPKP